MSVPRLPEYAQLLPSILTVAEPTHGALAEPHADNAIKNHQIVSKKLDEIGERMKRIKDYLTLIDEVLFSGPIQAFQRIGDRVAGRYRVNVVKLKHWLANNFPFNEPAIVDPSAIAKIVELVEFVNPVYVCSRVTAHLDDLATVLNHSSSVSVLVSSLVTFECPGPVASSYFSTLPRGACLEPGTVVASVARAHLTVDGIALETLAVANGGPLGGSGQQFSQGLQAVVEPGNAKKPLFKLTMFTDAFEADPSAIYAPVVPQALLLVNVLIPGEHFILMAKAKTTCYLRCMWLVWPWDMFCRGEHTFYWIWPIMTPTTDAHAIALSYEFMRPQG